MFDKKLAQINVQKPVYIENNFEQISSPQNLLVPIHGLGTYGAWFHELRDVLSEQKTASSMADLPAFGRSTADPQIHDRISFQEWTNSISRIWHSAAQISPSVKKRFLLGHSLGGVLALSALPKLNPKPDGLILTVPGLYPHPHSYPFFGFTIPTLLKALCKSKDLIPIPFPTEFQSPSFWAKIDTSLITYELKANVYFEILKALLSCWSGVFRKIDCPVLIILGQKDLTCLKEASHLYFKLLNAPQKQLIELEDYGHDLFSCDVDHKVSRIIASWIAEHS